MKTTILTILTAVCASGLLFSAAAQPTGTPNNTNNAAAMPGQSPPPPGEPDMGNGGGPDAGPPPAATETQPEQAATNAVDQAQAQPTETAPAENQSAESTVILPKGAAPEAMPSPFAPPAEAIGTNSDELRLNFRNAPLEMVLNYLSDAAGFIIVLDTHVSGNVTIISTHPVTKDEAVDLLNAQLNKNGYAAIRDGRMLTVVEKSEAKIRNIPVKSGNVPANIPKNDEMVTQIIPVRFVDARQLVSDLALFVSAQATIVANQAGNSIVVTDTQANIRHLAEIIQAVDNSAEAETEIRVFHLKYANPTDVASELGSIFPNSTSGNTAQSPIQFRGGGPGGFLGRMMANAAGNASSSQNDRMKKATTVTAVADARIQSVIVTAPKDLMEQIANMMTDLDVPSDRDKKVFVYHLDHGDPSQVAAVLQNTFGSTTTTSGNVRGGTSSSANSALETRAQQNASTIGNSSSSSTGFGNTRTGGVGNRGGTGGF